MPSAIMKWRPAPGIIRLPIPSTIAVNPMTAITIRTPTVIDRNHRRLPAVADVFDFNPVAIGPQRLVKISGGRRGGGRRSRVHQDRLRRRRNDIARHDGSGGRHWHRSPAFGRFVLEQRRDHGVREAEIRQIENFIGAGVKSSRRILDESENDILGNTRLKQFRQFFEARRELRRGHRDDGRSRIGGRWRRRFIQRRCLGQQAWDRSRREQHCAGDAEYGRPFPGSRSLGFHIQNINQILFSGFKFNPAFAGQPPEPLKRTIWLLIRLFRFRRYSLPVWLWLNVLGQKRGFAGIYRKNIAPAKTVQQIKTGGEMAEWFKAHAWKACVAKHYRGFESLSLPHLPPPPPHCRHALFPPAGLPARRRHGFLDAARDQSSPALGSCDFN